MVIERQPDATVIALSGELDGQAAGQLRQAASRAAATQRLVIIEMSEVTRLSAPAVGVLVGAWHSLEDRLTLRCSPPVHASLAEAGLDRLLPVA